MTPHESISLREYFEVRFEDLDKKITGLDGNVSQLADKVGRLVERQRFWLHLKNAVIFVGVLAAMATPVVALVVSSS